MENRWVTASKWVDLVYTAAKNEAAQALIEAPQVTDANSSDMSSPRTPQTPGGSVGQECCMMQFLNEKANVFPIARKSKSTTCNIRIQLCTFDLLHLSFLPKM